MMVLYVDDAGIAAPNQSIIDEFVAELKDLGFDLEIEGTSVHILELVSKNLMEACAT